MLSLLLEGEDKNTKEAQREATNSALQRYADSMGLNIVPKATSS